MSDLVLSADEVQDLTGYANATKQLQVLQRRGFARAFISRKGAVVLERVHFEAVRDREPEQPPAQARPDTPKPVHWRDRPEHQARLIREKEAAAEHRLEAEALDRLLAEQAVDAAAAARALSPARRAILVRHHAAKRRAARLQRTPPWVDFAAIRALHAEAHRLTEATGTPHHVDHAIPLQGERVSGLHVHTNMQILTASENSRKRNHFEADHG